MEFLKHKWLNKAWIAEQMYGDNTSATRSKLSQKIKGEINSFNENELKKLEEIREAIKNTL